MRSGDAEVDDPDRQLLRLVAEGLRNALDEKGMEQQELAERMGVSEARISRILSGHENLTLLSLLRLADALDVVLVVGFHDEASDRQNKPRLQFETWRESMVAALGWEEPIGDEKEAFIEDIWLEARARGRKARGRKEGIEGG